MDIKTVITVINQMQTDGVIERYAIGGAVGATFYLEPVATLDVDIFITFNEGTGSLLVSPQAIFDYLKARGCVMRGEYAVIAGWPVQFLPPTSPLVEEALREAATRDVDGVPACVLTEARKPPAFARPMKERELEERLISRLKEFIRVKDFTISS